MKCVNKNEFRKINIKKWRPNKDKVYAKPTLLNAFSFFYGYILNNFMKTASREIVFVKCSACY